MASVQVFVNVDQSGNNRPSLEVYDPVCGLMTLSGRSKGLDKAIPQEHIPKAFAQLGGKKPGVAEQEGFGGARNFIGNSDR
jgi:hypothetical protein